MASKELINLSNLQRFLLKLNEKFALKKAMKGISEDSDGNIIIGEEGLVPTPNENSKGKFLRSDGEWALPSETVVYDSMTIEEGIAGVSKVDKVLNAKNLKQIVNSDGFLTSLDSSKLTGVINIENLPQGALEKILIVSSKEERLTLSDTEVQLGDVVKEADTGLMYYVINTEKLNSEEGYTQFTAGMASSVPWSGVTDKPLIPTKTSQLINDSDFAIDSNVVHTSGDEYIDGVKTFNSMLKVSQGTLQVGSDAGYSVTYDWTGNIISKQPSGTYNISLPNANGTLAIDDNLVHRTGNEDISGVKSFNNLMYIYDNMSNKNSRMDLFTTPANNLYAHYMFVDKNNEICAYMQYGQQNSGTDFIGLFIHDKNRALHGLLLTTNNEFIPLYNNTYSLGSPNNKWADVYSTNAHINYTYTNRVFCDSVVQSSDNSYCYISGGSDWDKGANLYLSGVSATNFTPGSFVLSARKTDGSTVELAGRPNGTLTWCGQDIATTAWVRNYVNSVARSSISGYYSNPTTLTTKGSPSSSDGSSILAYYSNATTLTAEGSPSSSDGSYPSDYSDYIDISPKVGTIYTGSQLFGTLNASASGSGYTSSLSSGPIYQTTAKATATFSGAFSASAKYLCTTANAVKFRAFVSQGTTSDIGTASVVDNSSTKSIFIRVE